jgi:dephospho-CoA kinase
MSGWPGKYVIGLTGNIATGKSVVRKILEHLGAYGIDADALAHRVIMKGAPGYSPVVETFGNWILEPDGQVDRAKLGRIVFSDPAALERLESIIHPHVGQAVGYLIREARKSIIVVEAIKLIESGLADECDAVWTTYASRELQINRLVGKRGMSESLAQQRVDAQPPQEAKIGAAQVVIHNTGSLADTWRQVYSAWHAIIPRTEEPPENAALSPPELMVVRAGPGDSQQIASLINRLSHGRRSLKAEDIMAAFGEKAFLLLNAGKDPKGIAGWQVENLVARTDEVYLDPSLPEIEGLRLLMREVEETARELQCEVSLLFLPLIYQDREEIFGSLGYTTVSIQNMGVRSWEEAARESMPADSFMLVKQLREDRVLKPV